MRLIDKDEILKRRAAVSDKNGHLLFAVPTCEIWAAKTVDAVPLDKLCEWLETNARLVRPDGSRWNLDWMKWKEELTKWMEGLDAAD